MSSNCQCNKTLGVDAISNLKQKVLKEYESYIKSLNKGYKNDYSILLNEINFIEMYQDLDNQNLIYEYYINYGM